MAGIDKTFITNYEDYIKVIEWAKSVGTVTDDFGNRITPFSEIAYPGLNKKQWKVNYDYHYYEVLKNFDREDTKEDYKESIVRYYGKDWEMHPERFAYFLLWNTPTYFDVWLIRNCPLDFIQARLKEQYGSSYNKIKNRTSIYDTFKRSGRGKDTKFTITYGKDHTSKFRDDDIWWFVQIDNPRHGLDYNEKDRMWYFMEECKPTTTNTYDFKGNLGMRKLARLIKRWNLPKGIKIHFEGSYRGYAYKDFTVTVR